MTHQQKQDCDLLERELRGIACREKAIYKEQTLKQAAKLLRDLRDQDGWRPIATAPKDGRFVLLAGPSGYTSTPLRVAVGHWSDGGAYGPKSAGWRNHAHYWFTEGGEEPTLWMPLPEGGPPV